MPSWSDGEGGGAVHAALAELLGKGNAPTDMLCFASAGNTAQRHWSGQFQPGPEGFHQWQAGAIANELFPWSVEEVSVELCCNGHAGYEVMVYDDSAQRMAARSQPRDGAQPCALAARFVPVSGHNYSVRVRQPEGRPAFFHLISLGAWLHYSTVKGSIPFPADGPEVIAVGAVDASGRRASYSSCGPNSARPKPDLVAPVPFPSLWRPRPFSGTSASAPQAAALAALIWSRHPHWTAQQVRQTLQASATDLGPPGHDYETGYGLIRLP